MIDVLQNVLRCSYYGSVLIIVILFLRLIMRNAPRNIICLLWLVATLRLIMPFEIKSALSLQFDYEAVVQSSTVYARENLGLSSKAAELDTVDMLEYPVSDDSINMHTKSMRVYFLEIAAWAWILGFCCMWIYNLQSYLRLCHRVRQSVILSEGVWICGKVESAIVLGYLRPQIYLSPGLNEVQSDCILQHENQHIRRGDQWWKLLGFVSLSIHWFNPLIWVAFVLMCRDLEMACDEAVVRCMDASERKTYSAVLLECAAGKYNILAYMLAFGEVSVKARIKNVLNYKRPRFWIILIAVVVSILVSICLLTSPTGMDDGEILAAFYAQMEAFQSRNSYHMTIDTVFEGECAYYVSRKQEYWSEGDDWYRCFATLTSDGTVTCCYAQIDGMQYACEYSEDIEKLPDRNWQPIPQSSYASLFLLTEDFAQYEVLDVRREKTDNGGMYTVVLQGELTSDNPREKIYEKTWEFYLNRNGELVGTSLYTNGDVYLRDALGTFSGYYETKTYDKVTILETDEVTLYRLLDEVYVVLEDK